MVQRAFSSFVGVDLGGARGKTTAVARLQADGSGPGAAAVVLDVGTRDRDGRPWSDDVLIEHLATFPEAAIAIDAPLTVPACLRCQLSACPGQLACVDPAVVWLNTVGLELAETDSLAERGRVAAAPSHTRVVGPGGGDSPTPRPLLAPYTHRCTDILVQRGRRIQVRETLGQGTGPLTARALHLRRRLAGHGFDLHRNLLEVAPRATVHALFGARAARGYKRDADPWQTRAAVLEGLGGTLRFAVTSRLAREEVLRNDHCFDAVLSAYTAFLWARDGWELSGEHRDVFRDDGWIWLPPER